MNRLRSDVLLLAIFALFITAAFAGWVVCAYWLIGGALRC